MSKLRTVAMLPTLFTLGNLICGFFAIVVATRIDTPTSVEIPTSVKIGTTNPVEAIKALDREDPAHNMVFAGALIFMAMIFDALDGYVARLSRATTDFGAQLDSLCDVVTFGVAPAILLVKMCPRTTYLHPWGVWLIAATFVACAALRLARFNVESDEEDDHLTFSGLPSPAAAAAIASFGFLFYALRQEDNPFAYALPTDVALQTALLFFGLVVAALMVTRVPYPHIVNQVFRGQRSFGHIVGFLFALVALMVRPYYFVPLLCVTFVFWGPISYAWQEFVQRRPHKEPLF